jgi:flagella basal body P-ring formation protein FlgA
MLYLLLILILPLVSLAETANAVLENLITKQWNHSSVRVEWQFNGEAPKILESDATWTLCDPIPNRLAGSLILKLQSQEENGQRLAVVVSGTAKVYGLCFTVREKVIAGDDVKRENLEQTELEWTRLTAMPLNSGDFDREIVARHTLIPGRVITQEDIKAAPVVRNGEVIKVSYKIGQIRVQAVARALLDGAIGETIPVMVNNGKQKRLNAYIQTKDDIQLLL